MPTLYSEDVASVARTVCAKRFAGETSASVNGIGFVNPNGDSILRLGGWCGAFVRLCYAAAWRGVDPDFDPYGFPWLARYAEQSNEKLKSFAANGLYGIRRVPKAEAPAGCIIACLGDTNPGHIALWLGSDEVAENTSSSRGKGHPGTGITSWAEFAPRAEAFYQLRPSRGVALPNRVTIVGLDGARRPVGWLSDEGISYAPVRAVVEACDRGLEWDADTRTSTVKEA